MDGQQLLQASTTDGVSNYVIFLVGMAVTALIEFVRLEMKVAALQENKKDTDKRIEDLKRERERVEDKIFDKIDELKDSVKGIVESVAEIKGGVNELKRNRRDTSP